MLTIGDFNSFGVFLGHPVGPLNWNLGVRACRITHLITIMAACQLQVLANEDAELAGCSQ